MPTYLSFEKFACDHVLETRHGSFGSDGSIISETIPIPLRCLACMCWPLIGASLDGLNAVPRSFIRDVATHYEMLTRKPDIMCRELRQIFSQVQEPCGVTASAMGCSLWRCILS